MFSINVFFQGGRDGGSRGKAEGGGTVADIQDPPPEVKVRVEGRDHDFNTFLTGLVELY